MAFDRRLLAVFAAPMALFAAGAGAAWAARYGFWASAAVCLLAAIWATALMIARARRGTEAPVPPPSPPPTAKGRDAVTLAAILDHSPAPLISRGDDRSLRCVNRAARRLFATDELIPAPPPELIAAIAHADPGDRGTAIFSLDGRQRAYALSIVDLVEGEHPMRLAALIDIQTELQAAEAAALRELISVLSHEIMNSLTPVTSLAETARDALLPPRTETEVDLAQEAVETLARRATGLLGFVEAYRALARLPPPKRISVWLDELLDEAERLFEGRWRSQGVRLLRSPPSGLRVHVDPDLMMQALINLLANAAEAALEGEAPPVVQLVSGLDDSGNLRITVADNGLGIGDVQPETLFRAFFTTKREGTGVGLSLARQIVRAHGGELYCESTDKAGTTFLIELPGSQWRE